MEAAATAAAVSGKPGYLPVIVWNTEGLSKTTLSQPEKYLVQHWIKIAISLLRLSCYFFFRMPMSAQEFLTESWPCCFKFKELFFKGEIFTAGKLFLSIELLSETLRLLTFGRNRVLCATFSPPFLLWTELYSDLAEIVLRFRDFREFVLILRACSLISDYTDVSYRS